MDALSQMFILFYLINDLSFLETAWLLESRAKLIKNNLRMESANDFLWEGPEVQGVGNPAAGPILLRLRLTDYTKISSKILPVGDCQPPSLHC
nr:hypothetical protein CFP56_63828 [Quercus suber]